MNSSLPIKFFLSSYDAETDMHFNLFNTFIGKRRKNALIKYKTFFFQDSLHSLGIFSPDLFQLKPTAAVFACFLFKLNSKWLKWNLNTTLYNCINFVLIFIDLCLFQASWYVQTLLYSVCKEINRVAGHAVKR